MNEESRAGRNESEHKGYSCPLCTMMKGLSEIRSRHAAFFKHLTNARIEVLQAFKSLIDQQIASLEQQRNSMGEIRKVTKITVE